MWDLGPGSTGIRLLRTHSCCGPLGKRAEFVLPEEQSFPGQRVWVQKWGLEVKGAGEMHCGEGAPEQVGDMLCWESRGPKRGKGFEENFSDTLGVRM